MKPFLVILLLIGGCLHSIAQIPMRYAITQTKGRVKKMEVKVYNTITVDANRKPILNVPPPARSIIELQQLPVKDGILNQPTVMRNYVAYNGTPERLNSKTVFSYDQGKLMQVEEFNNLADSEAGVLSLGLTSTPIYREELMVSENVTDAKGRLISSYNYQYTQSGLLTVDHFYFDGDNNMHTGNRYGFKVDSLGRVLQFGMSVKDTFSFNQRLTYSDTMLTNYLYTISGGLKTNYTSQTWTERDSVGNTVMTLEALKKETGEVTYALYLTRYQYEGQPDFETMNNRVVGLESIVDGWYNRQENIKFILDPPTSTDKAAGELECAPFYNGAPTSANSPRYWIDQLSKVESGHWKLDTTAKLLEFINDDGTSIKLDASFDGEILVLQPQNQAWQSLRLIRRKKT